MRGLTMAYTRGSATAGNLDWFVDYTAAFANKLLHDYHGPEGKQIKEAVHSINSSLGSIQKLRSLSCISETPAALVLEPDNTENFVELSQWMGLISEVFADEFYRNGKSTISSFAEAACYVHALARIFGSEKMYFRGESKYGNKLLSRAERKMSSSDLESDGISEIELHELARFQKEVRSDPFQSQEIARSHSALPADTDPSWLPIMQHYDEHFGTRLLDITSSIFTGLYFSCVDWDGRINDEVDGILYVFLKGGDNSTLHARGMYLEKSNSLNATEFDDVVPNVVEDSFRGWQAPDYFRVYQSITANPREMAQDGLFLVRSSLKELPRYGQNFKIRIPASAKFEIMRQLWRAGYTPERVVRGKKGQEAQDQLGNILGYL
jgi:FRG domain